jgi:hypothetical protein
MRTRVGIVGTVGWCREAWEEQQWLRNEAAGAQGPRGEEGTGSMVTVCAGGWASYWQWTAQVGGILCITSYAAI